MVHTRRGRPEEAAEVLKFNTNIQTFEESLMRFIPRWVNVQIQLPTLVFV